MSLRTNMRLVKQMEKLAAQFAISISKIRFLFTGRSVSGVLDNCIYTVIDPALHYIDK
jgi:hypothetical protein